MNDLITMDQIQNVLPNFMSGFHRTQQLFSLIHTFKDVETYLLKGQGLAASSYKTYMVAVRQLYDFSESLHPFQVTLGVIEAFYDHWAKEVDRQTVYNKIKALQRFFLGVENVAPYFRSPFRDMPDRLKNKLNRTKKGKTKKSLHKGETIALLDWLELDTSLRGKEDYAIMLTLTTSGLRADELCQLCFKSLEYDEGQWIARFIGKGGEEAEQEIYPPALDAIETYFRAHFHRKPQPDDKLFWTIPNNHTDPTPLNPHNLWSKVKAIGMRARKEGIIKRDLNWSPHLLRRTYATLLYKSGMKLKAIMEKTRHGSIEVLARHYIKDEEPATPYFKELLA